MAEDVTAVATGTQAATAPTPEATAAAAIQAELSGRAGPSTGAPATPEKPDAAPAKGADAAGKTFAVTEQVRQWAKSIGYSDEEIGELEEVEAKAIERAALRQRQRIAELGELRPKVADLERQLEEAKAKGQLEEAKAKAPTRPRETETSDPEAERDAPTSLDLLPDDADGDAAFRHLNNLTGAHQSLAQDHQALKAELADLKASLFAAESRRYDRAKDAFWSSIDAEHEGRYGRGPMKGLHAESPEIQQRERVHRIADSLADAYEEDGEEVDTPEACARILREAFAIANRKDQTPPDKANTDAEAERIARSAGARPSGSKTRGLPEETPEEKAAREIELAARKRGIPA